MRFSEQQQRWLEGAGGCALQWGCNSTTRSATLTMHFAPDTRMAGGAGYQLLESLVAGDLQIRLPGYLVSA